MTLIAQCQDKHDRRSDGLSREVGCKVQEEYARSWASSYANETT
jgi:hypothetical protein